MISTKAKQAILEHILKGIKKENNDRIVQNEKGLRSDNNSISLDESNEALLDIFNDAQNTFKCADFELIDDQDFLEEFFGGDGWERIRDAEQGMY